MTSVLVAVESHASLSCVQRPWGWWLTALLVVACPVFYVFSYNSGYGYDQLEYLVMARSLTEGMPFYHFIPSKSFGIYTVLAGLMELGVPLGHYSLSALLTGIFTVTVGATYLALRKPVGGTVAFTAAILTGLCSMFMEQNFLTTEGWVYLCGLLAFWILTRRASGPKALSAFLAGLAIAGSMHFKSVGVFYAASVGLYVVGWGLLRHRLGTAVGLGAALTAGFTLGVGVVVAYFVATGRFAEWYRWTISYPIFDYPSSTTYVSKLYTKLLPIHGIIILAVALLGVRGVGRQVLTNPVAILGLMMGLFSYVALLKGQASHYCFAGAPFLMIFTAVVLNRVAEVWGINLASRWLWGGLTGMGVLVAVAVVLYRPDAAKRFLTFRNYETQERPIRELLQARVPADQRLLVFRNTDTWCYWLSHRYPPGPFINNDEKTMWHLRNQPEAVLGMLEARDLAVVDFDPDSDKMEMIDLSETWGKRPGDREAWQAFGRRLSERFEPAGYQAQGHLFWVRK